MSTLLIASVFLLLLWPAYAALLKYSERYALNRFLLVAVMVAVCALPFVSFESPAPAITQSLQGTIEYVELRSSPSEVIAPVVERTTAEIEPVEAQALTEKPIHKAQTSSLVYFGGVGLMLVLLSGRMLFLLSLHLRSRLKHRAGYRLLHPGASPGQAFTFGRSVYFSQDVPDDPDFDHILTHERVHARQLHSVDIMLAEVFLCLFWFHPVAWWLRTKMRANLEYLVDKAVVKQGADRRNYQLALVRQSVAAQGLALALPFSEPSLKSRITRMTGLPEYRVIGILAAVALTFWLGVAMVVVNGKSSPPDISTVLPRETTFAAPSMEDVQESFLQRNRSGIESFELYFRRLPTPYEFAQIRQMLGALDNTRFSLYHPCDAEEGEFVLQLSHWLNLEARMPFYLKEGDLMEYQNVFKLEPHDLGGTDGAPHVSAGYFRPMVKTTVLDEEDPFGRHGRMFMSSDSANAYSKELDERSADRLVRLDDYREDIADEEIAVFINGERRTLRDYPEGQVNTYGSSNEVDPIMVKINDRPVPTWSQSYFATWAEVEAASGPALLPANERMNCLLGMSGNQWGQTRNVRYGYTGSSRAWFERMHLPEGRKILYYLNDELSTAAEVLDRKFEYADVQVGYDRNNPNGDIIVQAIDELSWFVTTVE
ncbi:hypothetical protein FUA23_04975 [Neolewinella aurantiaca]|uniref:Peptidase M56 domain-containing protein n=1 Tax=Neolewinella aurantiaca TaxID=2602767 RepID=A0A5C7FHU6_9BACT|nr:M56 family metallopeptidase [Neolewinella aurantiaca]TXF90794.1 hypothetical protein FUA23_04975 [Neolewinella aurantiaca]